MQTPTYQVAVREVTLIIRTPVDASPPSEWHWPDLIDCQDDDVEFVSETFLGEVEYEADPE